MPRRARSLAESGVYHIMVRGVNRDAIFLEDEDYHRYLRAIAQAKLASGCRVLAYCLMSNHAHLLLRTGHESLGNAMRRVGVRYSGWFNHKYDRVGHLFQDRYLSRPVDTDAYLLTLVRYIWHNPVKSQLVRQAVDYPWNSCWSGGSPAGLVDDSELDALVPALARAELAAPVLELSLQQQRPRGRPARHSPEQVAELIARSCAAHGPVDFGLLDSVTQRRVVRELRMRSVSYDSIAAATGLHPSKVRRMQAGRVAGEWGDDSGLQNRHDQSA